MMELDPGERARNAARFQSVVAVDDRRIGAVIAAGAIEVVAELCTSGASRALVAIRAALFLKPRYAFHQADTFVTS